MGLPNPFQPLGYSLLILLLLYSTSCVSLGCNSRYHEKQRSPPTVLSTRGGVTHDPTAAKITDVSSAEDTKPRSAPKTSIPPALIQQCSVKTALHCYKRAPLPNVKKGLKYFDVLKKTAFKAETSAKAVATATVERRDVIQHRQ